MAKQGIDPTKGPGLTVNQIFLVKASFAHRADFLALRTNTPIGELQVLIETVLMTPKEGTGVALSVTARTDQEDKAALYQFSAEIMAMIDSVPGQENIPPLQFVATAGVATVFPFLREMVANLTMRGRFGPVWLKPINIRLATEGLGAGSAKEGLTAAKESPARRSKAPRRRT